MVLGRERKDLQVEKSHLSEKMQLKHNISIWEHCCIYSEAISVKIEMFVEKDIYLNTCDRLVPVVIHQGHQRLFSGHWHAFDILVIVLVYSFYFF